MPEGVTELRNKARHRLELARATREAGMRSELVKMAGEFNEQADERGRKEPRG